MRHLATASLSMMVLLIPVAAWAQPDIKHSTITSERLVDAGKDPSNWLLYSGQYNSQRFSQLKQIHDGNVEDLRVKSVSYTHLTLPTPP